MPPQIKTHKPDNATVNLVIWGREGIGKTYLAASMPKPAMYLTFDPNAMNGVNDLIVDGVVKEEDLPYLSFDEGNYREVASAYKNSSNPFSLDEAYDQMPFKTLVVDSLTSFFKLAMQYAVSVASTFETKKGIASSMEQPGLAGYGVRSMVTKEMIFNVVNWCRKKKVNCVLIAHEGALVKDEVNGLMYHELSLSGDIPMEMSRWVDEVWFMAQNGEGKRSVCVHTSGRVRPLKTRMFADDVTNFEATNLNLTELIDAWRKTGKIDDLKLQSILKG